LWARARVGLPACCVALLLVDLNGHIEKLKHIGTWKLFLYGGDTYTFHKSNNCVVLEVLALFFGEEYVREKKSGGLRN
jgi:hypothetical protein